jgi:hypothetical protein
VKNLYARILAKVQRKQGLGKKKFMVWTPLFIRAGGSFKKSPRFDRCEFSGGHVSTPMFRGWHFLPKFESFHGNRSSESTRFPEGLVLGNSIKHLHPRNVELSKFMKQVCESIMEERSNFVERGDHEEILMYFECFTSFWTSVKIMAKLVFCVRTFNLFQDVWLSRNSGIGRLQKSESRNSRSSGIMNLRSSGIMNLQNYAVRNLRNSSQDVWRSSWMRYSGVNRKPSQIRLFKSPGLKCELVADM